MENSALEKVASQVRRDIVRMVSAVNSGHPGGSLGCADFLSFLYFEQMNFNAESFDMDGIGEDLFFLSNGHISPVWYSVLARAGYFPVAELATLAESYGYTVHAIEVSEGLHLKSIVNYVGKNTLILNEEGVNHPAFKGFNHIVLAKEEEYAGNTLWINDTLITPKGYPDTYQKIEKLGLPIISLDTSEFRKMDGGLTCLSLRF